MSRGERLITTLQAPLGQADQYRVDRGQHMVVVVLLFVGTLAAAAFLYIVLDQAWVPLMDISTNASNTSDSAQGIQDAKTAWNNALLFVLGLAFILGVAGAAAVSGRR